MATRMQQRRGTASQWTIADPVLAAGEIGVESDTGQFKIGDGVNEWSLLDYFSTTVDLTGYATESYVDDAVAGVLDNAPAALDTLNELAEALGDDANFASTITTQLSGKADVSHTHTISEITDYSDPNFNVDGGKADTLYGGTIEIQGGNAGSF